MNMQYQKNTLLSRHNHRYYSPGTFRGYNIYGITGYAYFHNYNYCLTRQRLMAANYPPHGALLMSNRVSPYSELSAARRSLRHSVLPSEFAAYLALSATRRFANRVSLSSELSAARRSLLLRSLASFHV